MRLYLRAGVAALAVGLLLPVPSSAHAASASARLNRASARPNRQPNGEAPSPPGAMAEGPLSGESTAAQLGGSGAASEVSEPPRRATRHRVRRAANLRGSCHLSVTATPRLITLGEAPTVTGALACAEGSGAASRQVTLYRRERDDGTRRATAVATATTGADGSFEFTAPPLERNCVLFVRSVGIRSERMPVKVAAQVTLTGTPDGTPLFVGGGHSRAGGHSTVLFSGTVSPARMGTVVVLQRRDANGTGHWRRIGLTRVGLDGSYSINHTFGAPGEAILRAVARLHGHNAVAASEPLSYEIVGRQKPRSARPRSARPRSAQRRSAQWRSAQWRSKRPRAARRRSARRGSAGLH
jgi:hypothetical protein